MVIHQRSTVHQRSLLFALPWAQHHYRKIFMVRRYITDKESDFPELISNYRYRFGFSGTSFLGGLQTGMASQFRLGSKKVPDTTAMQLSSVVPSPSPHPSPLPPHTPVVLPSYLFLQKRERERGRREREGERARERCRQRRGAVHSVISAQCSESQCDETTQAWVNGGSNYDSLKVAKCLVV